MDVVTGVETVESVISLIGGLNTLLGCIDTILKASTEMKMVKEETANLLAVLQNVEYLIQRDESCATYLIPLTKKGGPIDAAQLILKELFGLLGGDEPGEDFRESMKSLTRRIKELTLDDVKWPHTKKKVEGLLQRLERQKTTINMALSHAIASFTLVDITNRVDGLTEGLEKTNKMISVMDRRKILKRILPMNEAIPRIHKERRAQQEPETCTWVTREDGVRNFLAPHRQPDDTSNRFVCIHGIPGAGKTVLASYVIEIAAANCKAHGYAYYYCLYSREQDETIPFLKWILRQLCWQTDKMVPSKIKEADDKSDGISKEDLLDCLEQVSSHYENGVYIVIDAVDESKPRDNLVKVLTEIGTADRFWKVSLLFTCREENDIMMPINRLGKSCTRISMSNPNVREDVKRYVHNQLIAVHAFSKYFDAAVLAEVENQLTQKAKGMFRWAACQLDVLKRKKTIDGLRETLKTLPEDIFSTYERILTEIPTHDQVFAKTALALMCSDTAHMPAAEILVRACLYNVPYHDIPRYTVNTLRDTCGSLVSVHELARQPNILFQGDGSRQRFHRCNLAHYTVKEYLYSSSVANGPAKFFALSDKIVRYMDLKVGFIGLSHFAQHQTGKTITLYEQYCLNVTEHALLSRRKDIISSADIAAIVLKSLTPKSPHFLLRNTHGVRTIMKAHFPIWNSLGCWDPTPPGTGAVGLLVNLARLRWSDLAQKYLESPDFTDLSRSEKMAIWTEYFKLNFKMKDEFRDTILTYCLREKLMEFVSLFVRNGAAFDKEPEALYTAMVIFHDSRNPESETLEALKLLLSAGANPDPIRRQLSWQEDGDFIFTPLQFAVYKLEPEWVELLLEEGANVEATGSPDGVFPLIFDDTDKHCENLKALQGISQLTPLELCARTSSQWIREKEMIDGLLRRHGAKERMKKEADEDGDEEMVERFADAAI